MSSQAYALPFLSLYPVCSFSLIPFASSDSIQALLFRQSLADLITVVDSSSTGLQYSQSAQAHPPLLLCFLKLRRLGEQFPEGGTLVPSFSHVEGVVLEE